MPICSILRQGRKAGKAKLAYYHKEKTTLRQNLKSPKFTWKWKKHFIKMLKKNLSRRRLRCKWMHCASEMLFSLFILIPEQSWGRNKSFSPLSLSLYFHIFLLLQNGCSESSKGEGEQGEGAGALRLQCWTNWGLKPCSVPGKNQCSIFLVKIIK